MNTIRFFHNLYYSFMIWLCSLVFSFPAFCEESTDTQLKDIVTLSSAIMCEGIDNQKPVNPTVVFPVSRKNAYCLTDFSSVKAKTHIYHKWYRRDRLVTKIRLEIHPPCWSIYSNISFRDQDKGPWRIDITDMNNILLKTLRFSVTEE